MGPSPEKETSGDTTSWRLCLARSLGAVRGTGGTARRLRVRPGPESLPSPQNMRGFCALANKDNWGLSLDLGTFWAGKRPSSTGDQSGQGPRRTEFCPLVSLGHKGVAP